LGSLTSAPALPKLARMTDGAHKGLLIAMSAVWIALASGYMAWGAIYHDGLYRWLADLQVAQTGGYYPRWTAIIPALLLCLPAIWVLRRQAEIGQAEMAARGPAGEAERLGKGARNMAIAGVVAGIVGFGVHAFAQSVPDGSEPAVPFDVSALGNGGAVPGHKISVRGQIDPAITTGVTETGGDADRSTLYAAFVPEGAAAKDAPVLLFVERSFTGPPDAAPTQAFLPDQEGYLVENGLPALALSDLETQGVRVASPHYVLRPPGDGPRTPYYVAIALCGLLFVIFLLVAVISAVKARGRVQRLG